MELGAKRNARGREDEKSERSSEGLHRGRQRWHGGHGDGGVNVKSEGVGEPRPYRNGLAGSAWLTFW